MFLVCVKDYFLGGSYAVAEADGSLTVPAGGDDLTERTVRSSPPATDLVSRFIQHLGTKRWDRTTGFGWWAACFVPFPMKAGQISRKVPVFLIRNGMELLSGFYRARWSISKLKFGIFFGVLYQSALALTYSSNRHSPACPDHPFRHVPRQGGPNTSGPSPSQGHA
jgi:hypothetical protein